MPLHFINQRSALQAKSGGCAIPPSNYPTSCVKGAQNQGAFGIHQSSWSRDDADMLRPGGQQRIRKHTIFGKDQGTLNKILQFTDVAGPVVRAEVQHCFLGDMVDLPAYPPAKKLDKVRYEGRYILAALSQWRQLDRKYIQAKVEVTAKFAISYHPRQVAMGGSYEPHIHLMSPAASQAIELLFLQYA